MQKESIRDKRKQQLIDAAITSIAKNGYADTTISRIAEGADMARGIINFYFTSKQQMMQETLDYLAEQYTSRWFESIKNQENPRSAILALVKAHFHAALCNARNVAVWAAFWSESRADSGFRATVQRCEEALVMQLERLLKTTGLHHPQDTARNIASVIRGMWLQMLLNPSANRHVLCDSCLLVVEGLLEGEARPAMLDNVIAFESRKPRELFISDEEMAQVARNQMELF